MAVFGTEHPPEQQIRRQVQWGISLREGPAVSGLFCYTGGNSKGEELLRTAIVCGALVALTVTAAGAAQDPRFSANHFFPDCKAFAEEPDHPLNFGMG
jgi:hypothetical protein